jgi:putative transposase
MPFNLLSGYSHALGTILGRKREIWQRGFTDHRIRDEQDFANHLIYVHRNPVERKLVNNPCEYRYCYCSAFPGFKLDPLPSAAKAEISKIA